MDLNDSPGSGSIPMPAADSNFRVVSPASSSETYQVMQCDGSFLTRTEEMLNTWFVSDGSFDYSKTTGSTENVWGPPGSKPVLPWSSRETGVEGLHFRKIEMNL